MKNTLPPKKALTIVIPARNEESRLPGTLLRIEHYASRSDEAVEVLVVDDGSTDRTTEVALEAAPSLCVRVIPLDAPTGPGAAVKRGVLEAVGDRILLCDADGPVPFDDLRLLHAAIDEGAAIAAGSRALHSASILHPQPRHRILMGKVWRRLVQKLVPTGVLDTQCGFKLIDRTFARPLFLDLTEHTFVFHVELLLLAQRNRLSVTEVPVRWSDNPDSRIKLLADPVKMLAALIRLAYRHKRTPHLTHEEFSHAS